jgi:phage gp16-like protein
MTRIPFDTRMKKAIAWFDANRDAIEAALPLSYPGGEFLPERPAPEGEVFKSAVAVAQTWIDLWLAAELSNFMARTYVLRPLRLMYQWRIETMATQAKRKSSRSSLIGWIHQKKNRLKLDDETYRDVLFSVVGETSCKNMTIAQLHQCNQHFEGLANPATAAPRKLSPKSKGTADSNTQAAKIRALWITLCRLGAVKDSSEAALNSYCKRMTGMERLVWAERYPQHCNTIIEALKDWVVRTLVAIVEAQTPEASLASEALGAFEAAEWKDFNRYLARFEAINA